MFVKDVFLHDHFTKEALNVFFRACLSVNRELFLCELSEAKSALEVLLFLFNCHGLTNLTVKQVLIHQLLWIRFITVCARQLNENVTWFLLQALTRVGLFLHV